MTRQTCFAPKRRALLVRGVALAASACLLPPALRAQVRASEPAAYVPQRGQPGKDVMWIATPDALVTRMLRLAQLTPQDRLIDLGSGDGRIVIAAAREGAQALGIELNADLVALSRRRAAEAQLAERARFESADLFDTDLSGASVITMYLLPLLNLRLRPRLMALAPGTRIVSHAFRMGRWQPDESSRIGSDAVHLWLVPANAGGDWKLTFAQRAGPVTVGLSTRQRFQNVQGEAVFSEFTALLRDAKVAGERFSFDLTDADGHLRRFVGRIVGDAMEGTVYDFSAGGTRAPFSARRSGPAPAIEGSGPAPESEAESLGND